jgi:hypothetical protein
MYYLRLKKYENRLTNTPDQLCVFSAHNNCVLTGVTQALFTCHQSNWGSILEACFLLMVESSFVAISTV